MDFWEIQDVFKRCPDDVKIALFPFFPRFFTSNNGSSGILVYSTLIEGFNRDPKRIVAKNEDLTLEGVSHYRQGLEEIYF